MAAIMSCYGSYRGAHRREGTAWCSRLGDHPGVHIGWGEGSRGTRAKGYSTGTRVLTGRVLKGLEELLGVPPRTSSTEIWPLLPGSKIVHSDSATCRENKCRKNRRILNSYKGLKLLKHACECLT